MDKKWVHIIGIAGITTSALAVMFKQLGWHVTGSDNDMYDPGKSLLEKNGITYFTDYSYSHLIDNDRKPDLVVIQSGKPLNNKELLFAKKQNLNIKNYPQILEEFVVKKGKSIVVTGTYGKSTLTSLLIFLFEKFGINISYMTGSLSESITETIKPKFEATEYSIVEGDEYISSRNDPKSKFFYYHPNILILNPIEWDHSDVFKTKEEYINNFIELVAQMPKDGIIFSADTPTNSSILEKAICTKVIFNSEIYEGKTKLIGEFNLENIAFVYNILEYLSKNRLVNINFDDLPNYIEEFKGVKRRLELRFSSVNLIVIDDFGSSPAKVRGSLESVRKLFPDYKKIIIFDPNEGSRTNEILKEYDNLFEKEESVILTEFREIPNRLTHEELSTYLKTKGVNIKTTDDSNLINTIKSELIGKSVVIFMGSHDFETSIQNLIKSL